MTGLFVHSSISCVGAAYYSHQEKTHTSGLFSDCCKILSLLNSIRLLIKWIFIMQNSVFPIEKPSHQHVCIFISCDLEDQHTIVWRERSPAARWICPTQKTSPSQPCGLSVSLEGSTASVISNAILYSVACVGARLSKNDGLLASPADPCHPNSPGNLLGNLNMWPRLLSS